MLRTFLRAVMIGAVALSLAAFATAQTTQSKETVPGGAAAVKTMQVKGEVVTTGSNWLIAKDPTGTTRSTA